MAEGVDLIGGFDPTTWRRGPGCLTVIAPSRTSGALFGHELTNETRIDGFEVRGARASISMMPSAAITVQAGGTLTNLSVVGGGGIDSIGVHFSAPAGTFGASPILFASTVVGGAAMISTGVRV